MGTALKQRILGVIVLLALLGFCLTVLLHDNQSGNARLQKINTHPPITQPVPPTASEALQPNATNSSAQNLLPAQPTQPQPSSQPQPQLQTVQTPPPVQTPAQPPQLTQVQSQIAAPAQLQTSLAPVAIPTATRIPSVPAVTHHKAKKTTPKYAASSTAILQGRAVQVGTFTVKANAESLVNTLRKKGFTAAAEKVDTSKGEMTRVIVGGDNLTSAQAKALQAKLSKTMNLKGYIVSYTPDAKSSNNSHDVVLPTAEG